MKSNESAIVYNTHPVVSELNRVKGFDPLRFLKKTENGVKMELKYKKLWFRIKHPNGRIKLSALKITDQLAIIEARIFFDKNDTEPQAMFTARSDRQTAPGGLYIETAQHNAVDQALTDAGFGVQFVPDVVGNTAEVESIATAPAVTKVNAEQESAPQKTVQEAPASMPAEPIAEPVQETAAPVIQEFTPLDDEGQLPFDAPASQEVVTEAPIAFVPSVDTTAAETVVEPQAEPAAQSGGYSNEMSVEEICSRMTLEEAENYIVPVGTCNGQTMGQVADRRPASLRYYMTGYTGDNNILRAAATLVSQNRLQQAS